MKLFFILTVVVLIASCSEKKPVDRMNDEQLHVFADSLAHACIIADGHVDEPEHLIKIGFNIDTDSLNVLVDTEDGEFDYHRAKKGGLDAPFMSIYIPSKYQLRTDRGRSLADSLIYLVDEMAARLPDKFALARSVDEVERNFKDGKISLPMGMENGSPIGDDVKNVQYFYDRGIRYITLTHVKDNAICDSSGDTTHTWNGLSPFGREVVKEMNRVGIMVDISHVDDSTFYQTMKLSMAPCIASHSSCRNFAPSARRNMTDDMIRKLGENGGVVLVNFYTAFLSEDAMIQNMKLRTLLDSMGLSESDSLAKPIVAEFRKENPAPTVNVSTVADHIDWVVKLAGIDHVGFGSDFNGVDGDYYLPAGLKDASQYPNLIYELLKRGYTEEEIKKICSGNFFRVWKEVDAIANLSKS